MIFEAFLYWISISQLYLYFLKTQKKVWKFIVDVFSVCVSCWLDQNWDRDTRTGEDIFILTNNSQTLLTTHSSTLLIMLFIFIESGEL